MNKREIESAIRVINHYKKESNTPHIIAGCTFAISALEKQMPKKPIIKLYRPALCPTCGNELSIHHSDGYYRHKTFMGHCDNEDCLQRLDWGNEDE